MRTIADMTRFAFQILLELAGLVVPVVCALLCVWLLLTPLFIVVGAVVLVGAGLWCLVDLIWG